MEIPSYPRHLAPAERRAVKMQAARDIAAATLKDRGIAGDAVDIEAVQSEAATQIALQWLSERVAALEAAAISKD